MTLSFKQPYILFNFGLKRSRPLKEDWVQLSYTTLFPEVLYIWFPKHGYYSCKSNERQTCFQGACLRCNHIFFSCFNCAYKESQNAYFQIHLYFTQIYAYSIYSCVYPDVMTYRTVQKASHKLFISNERKTNFCCWLHILDILKQQNNNELIRCQVYLSED